MRSLFFFEWDSREFVLENNLDSLTFGVKYFKLKKWNEAWIFCYYSTITTVRKENLNSDFQCKRYQLISLNYKVLDNCSLMERLSSKHANLRSFTQKSNLSMLNMENLWKEALHQNWWDSETMPFFLHIIIILFMDLNHSNKSTRLKVLFFFLFKFCLN